MEVSAALVQPKHGGGILIKYWNLDKDRIYIYIYIYVDVKWEGGENIIYKCGYILDWKRN